MIHVIWLLVVLFVLSEPFVAVIGFALLWKTWREHRNPLAKYSAILLIAFALAGVGTLVAEMYNVPKHDAWWFAWWVPSRFIVGVALYLKVFYLIGVLRNGHSKTR